jgi:hypothetical protein
MTPCLRTDPSSGGRPAKAPLAGLRTSVMPMRVIRGDGSLTDEELLPGFARPLNLVFSEPAEDASR